jgi:hypothetical protein
MKTSPYNLPDKPACRKPGVRPENAPTRTGHLLQDEIAERRGGRANEDGVPTDTADGPVGVTAMA